MDGPVPQMFLSLLDMAAGMVTKLGAIVLFTPLVLVPSIGVTIFGVYLGNMYLKAQLSVKRETRYVHRIFQKPIIAHVARNNARSPMLAQFSAAIHGIGMYASKYYSLTF